MAAAGAYVEPAEVIASVVLPLDAPLERAVEREQRVLVEGGRVDRAELRKLNEQPDPRVAKHIAEARRQLAAEDRELAHNAPELVDEQGELARKRSALRLAPHRRGERPVSKRDTPAAKLHTEARVMARAIVNSRGAHVIQAYLLKLRPILSGQPLFALRNAALVPLEGGYRYTYADDCARRRIAIGLLFLVCGRWTDQRTAFGSRSTRRGLLVAGWSVDRILRMVTPVGRRRYERHVFSRGSTCEESSSYQGDMALFQLYGFCRRKRLPAERCNPWEIGESGQPKNRYWIGCVVSDRDPRTEARNRPMTRLAAAFGGVLTLDPHAHAQGWSWAEETPEYAPKLSNAPPF